MRRKPVLISTCILMIFATTGNCRAGIIIDVERYNSSSTAYPAISGDLTEGTRSYTDRAHSFVQIPQVLTGAEYIMTCNNDKYFEFYRLDVTISQVAILYLFVDHRIGNGWIGATNLLLEPDLYAAGMNWVYDMGFTDTGLKLGIDEYGDGNRDQYFSIFSKNVTPGTLTLHQQYDVTNVGDRNMYSVAAVIPEPATIILFGIGTLTLLHRRR